MTFRSRRARVSTLSLFLLVALVPFRARAADPFAEASAIFRRAQAGEPGAAARARSLFEQLAAAQPKDPVFLAYAGSAATIVARDERSPIEKMKGVEAGLDQIDLAVRMLGPEHDQPLPGRLPPRVDTLIVASSTFLALPDAIFHRAREGKAMVEGILAHPSFGKLPPTVQAQVHWLSAVAYRNDCGGSTERGTIRVGSTCGQTAAEKAALTKALAADPSGPFAAQVRARLAEVAK